MQVRRAEQLRQKRCNESGGVEKRWKAGGNHTTTNRRSTKTSTTFCVFPLTENFLPLILRFQIRGTWKRQTARVRDGSRSVSAHEAPRVLTTKTEPQVPPPPPYFS